MNALFDAGPQYEAHAVTQPELSTARVWDVTGGTAPYVVRCDERGEWSCSCPQFFFRVGSRGRTACKHCLFVAKKLEGKHGS